MFFLVIVFANLFFFVYWISQVLNTGINILGSKVSCIRNIFIKKVQDGF